LYTACDKTLGHYRRYTPDELRQKFENAGFEVVSASQFNRLGVLGWYGAGLMGKRDLSPLQMRVYEMLMPLARVMDALKIGPGLSLIVVGRKPPQVAQMLEVTVTPGAALSLEHATARIGSE
jgi:hypothetical protein